MIGLRFLKDEKGSTMVFTALFLALFGLGFMAIVIDLSNLYIQRKAMITAADSAALAGAQVLRTSLGTKMSGSDGAITIAGNYASLNGADSLKTDVFVGQMPVTLPNGDKDTRQVVNVTVTKSQPTIFAKFVGVNSIDVKAAATATWGYVKKAYIGSFIPFFTFDKDYELNKIEYLHSKIPDSNSYGLADIGSGLADIKAAIAGTKVGGSYIYNDFLKGESGKGSGIYDAVVTRMQNSQSKGTAEERRKYMIGLIPIIDEAEFLRINDTGKSSTNWKLPIKYFAYFEILDVIKQNETDGSKYALKPDMYYPIGTPNNYSAVLPLTLIDKKGVADTLIIGKFTGEIINARTITQAGDQTNPSASGSTPATYSKLIK